MSKEFLTNSAIVTAIVIILVLASASLTIRKLNFEKFGVKNKENVDLLENQGERNKPETMELVDVKLREKVIGLFKDREENLYEQYYVTWKLDSPQKYSNLIPFCNYMTLGSLENDQVIVGYLLYSCNSYYYFDNEIHTLKGSGSPFKLTIDSTTYDIIGMEWPKAVQFEQDMNTMFPHDMQKMYLSEQTESMYSSMDEKLQLEATNYFMSPSQ